MRTVGFLAILAAVPSLQLCMPVVEMDVCPHVLIYRPIALTPQGEEHKTWWTGFCSASMLLMGVLAAWYILVPLSLPQCLTGTLNTESNITIINIPESGLLQQREEVGLILLVSRPKRCSLQTSS